MHNGYPKFLYHKEQGAKILYSQAEEAKLEGEWKDSPAAFENEAPSEVENQIDESEEVTSKSKRKSKKDSE